MPVCATQSKAIFTQQISPFSTNATLKEASLSSKPEDHTESEGIHAQPKPPKNSSTPLHFSPTPAGSRM